MKISFPLPDISLIAGIGIYNFIAFILIYNPKKRNINPTFLDAFSIVVYLNFLSYNPIIIASVIILNIQIKVFQFDLPKKKKRKSISELRNLVKGKFINKIKLYIPILIIIILISLFYDQSLWMAVIVVYFLSKLFHNLKKQITKNYFIIFILSLSIPIFTAQNHFNNINYTILGLSKEFAEVATTNGNKKGFITFKSSSELYLKSISEDKNENIIIPSSQILKIKIIDTVIKPKTGLEYLKTQIEELRK